MKRLSVLAGLCLFVGSASACATPAADDGAQQSGAAVVTGDLLLEGTFGRTAEVTPIMTLRFAPKDPVSGKIRFELALDLPGCKQGCAEAEVVGYATGWTGNKAAGTFTLAASGAVAAAAKPFLGRYIFDVTGGVLNVTNVASPVQKTFALRPLELPIKGAPQIAGAWKADSRAPAGSFTSLALTPGADASHGNFAASRGPAEPMVTGTYEVGPANFMTGAAPFVLTPQETPRTNVALWIGGVIRETDGSISDLQIIDGPVNTISGSFNYRRNCSLFTTSTCDAVRCSVQPNGAGASVCVDK
jgi:hypothetical protein